MLLEVPEGKKNILLHCCCAPCSGAVVECMVQNGLKPALFFSNSNITPREEYDLRLSELRRYAALFGLEVIEDEYDHDAWLDFALDRKAHGQHQSDAADDRSQELAKAPERGERCLRCFEFRLQRAARYAEAHGFEVLTTTLASSRWKSLEQVDEAGALACNRIGQRPSEVLWWPQNWRRGGLQPRRGEIIREQQFYNQTYCGCEFSERHEKQQ